MSLLILVSHFFLCIAYFYSFWLLHKWKGSSDNFMKTDNSRCKFMGFFFQFSFSKLCRTPLKRLVVTEKVLGIGETCPPDVGKAEAGTCDSWSPDSWVVRITGSTMSTIETRWAEALIQPMWYLQSYLGPFWQCSARTVLLFLKTLARVSVA